MKKLYSTTKCKKVKLNIGHILEVLKKNFRSSSKILVLEDLVNSLNGNLNT